MLMWYIGSKSGGVYYVCAIVPDEYGVPGGAGEAVGDVYRV